MFTRWLGPAACRARGANTTVLCSRLLLRLQEDYQNLVSWGFTSQCQFLAKRLRPMMCCTVAPAVQGQQEAESQDFAGKVYQQPTLDKRSKKMHLERHLFRVCSVSPVPVHVPEEYDDQCRASNRASDNQEQVGVPQGENLPETACIYSLRLKKCWIP